MIGRVRILYYPPLGVNGLAVLRVSSRVLHLPACARVQGNLGTTCARVCCAVDRVVGVGMWQRENW